MAPNEAIQNQLLREQKEAVHANLCFEKEEQQQKEAALAQQEAHVDKLFQRQEWRRDRKKGRRT